MDDETKQALEAAVFRRLVAHLQNRTDVQNIDLMITAASAATAWATGTATPPPNAASRWKKTRPAPWSMAWRPTTGRPDIRSRRRRNSWRLSRPAKRLTAKALHRTGRVL